MSDEDPGFEDNPLADETMTRDLAAGTDLCPLLNLDKGTNSRLITNLAPVQIHKSVNLHVAPEFHIGGD